MFVWGLVVTALLVASYFAVQVYIRKVLVERDHPIFRASHPGRVRPNGDLLGALSPGLYPLRGSFSKHKGALRIRIFMANQLWQGDSNPALVMQESPFIVAAYSFDCDAVLLLRFLPETVADIKARGMVLGTGTRLLSVNTYFASGQEHKGDEVVQGPLSTRMWRSFRPYIAQFMCDNSQLATIQQRMVEIPSERWERTRVLGLEKMRECDLDAVRWGNPMYVELPGSYKKAIGHAQGWNLDY